MPSVPCESGKTCSKCLLKLPLSEFSQHSNTNGCLRTKCNDCFRQYKRERYQHKLRSEALARDDDGNEDDDKDEDDEP